MIRGVDVSVDQGNIDWAAVKESGQVQFVYAKATEGVSIRDEQFLRNKTVCKERGIPFGPYHFFHPSENPVEQANAFFDFSAPWRTQQDLLPMVDVEVDDNMASQDIIAALKKFLTAIKHRAVIYTSYGFWNYTMNGNPDFSSYLLWIAEYNQDQNPTLPVGWTDWAIWQRSDSGKVPGIPGNAQGCVDLDMLNPKLQLSALYLMS